jgi:hypothetical protein
MKEIILMVLQARPQFRRAYPAIVQAAQIDLPHGRSHPGNAPDPATSVDNVEAKLLAVVGWKGLTGGTFANDPTLLPACLADLKFDAPSFHYDSETALGLAILRLAEIIKYEGLTRDTETPISWDIADLDNWEPRDPKPLVRFVKQAERDLTNLVLRNYEEFSRASTSLLIQLINIRLFSSYSGQGEDPVPSAQDYKAYYALCLEMRGLLCMSPREIEDDPGLIPLRRLFGLRKPLQAVGCSRTANESTESLWVDLVGFVARNSTREFLQKMRKEAHPSEMKQQEKRRKRRFLFLDSAGIYKRLRTVNVALRSQRSVESLDWDLGRFDLLGCRLNCTLTGQKFIAYEEAWSLGDPFFSTNLSAKAPGEHGLATGRVLESKSRVRWLCLRTNVLTGSYNAWQIAALMDPSSFDRGFWDSSRVNLSRLRIAVGALLGEYCSSWRTQYRNYAFHRFQIRTLYKDWHRLADDIAASPQMEPGERSRLVDTALWFGTFLYEGVVDVMIYLLNPKTMVFGSSPLWRSRGLVSQAFEILEDLRERVRHGIKYTAEYDRRIATQTLDSLELARQLLLKEPVEDSANWTLYDRTMDLLKNIKNDYSGREGGSLRSHQLIEHLLQNLTREKDLFKKLLCQQSQPPNTSVPVFHLPDVTDERLKEVEKLVKRWLNVAQQLHDLEAGAAAPGPSAPDVAQTPSQNASRHNSGALQGELRQEVRAIQRLILRQLVHLRNVQKKYLMDVKQRSKDDVLARIKNLVLLFDPRADENGGLGHMTAYDLFYYVRSLVPVEIQIRTKLADTVAEQYHDTVYKGQPPQGTEIEREMLDEVGEAADIVDRDLEIDYEDYVTKWYLNHEEPRLKPEGLPPNGKERHDLPRRFLPPVTPQIP